MMDEESRAVLKALQDGGNTSAAIAGKINRTVPFVKRRLGALQDEGFSKVLGAGRARTWEITDPGREEVARWT